MSRFHGIPDDYDITALRTPPHSVEAEQSVIGGLLVSGSAFDAVAELLVADDFYRTEHSVIYGHIARLADAGQPIDLITVADALSAAGELEHAGGFAYLAQLAQNTPSVANIRAYATAVKDRAVLRQLIAAGQAIAGSAYEPGDRKPSELIDSAQALVMALGERVEHDVVTTNQALREVIDEIDAMYNSDSELTGLSTGFSNIDQRTSGLQKSDLIIVAGRPSMGKTTFAMNIAENVVLDGGKALIFSLEMSRNQLLKRMIASVGRLPLEHVRTGKLQDEEWPRLSSAISRLKDRDLIIDDRAALSIQQMRSTARKHHKAGPLDLIVVDYLQLATAGSSRDGRTEEVSAISRGLKAMAKELDVPVIALSQLNRELEKRPVGDRRPRNSDLRDSGAIEQDADLICMLYRDEVYRPEETDRKGVGEAIWTKFRNGEIGTDYLACRLQFGRFEPLAPEFWPRAESNVTPIRKRGGFDY